MSNDLWIRELTQVNRESQEEEHRQLDERWDRLSGGELSPEEEAELRALAASSEEGREAWEAFRPLGPGFHARVVQAIREEQGSLPEVEPVKPLTEPLPFRRRTFTPAGWGALAAAAAAAVVVLLVRPAAPLPDYSLEVSGSSVVWRGEAPELTTNPPVFAPGGRVTVVLSPATGTLGKGLDAECHLLRGWDQHRLEVLRTEIDPNRGSVKMECSIGHDLPPGTWTLWAIVGRGRLPTAPDLARLPPGVKIRTRNWVGVPAEIRIQPRERSP
ncbi:MAG TPA: hypothetical protein VKM72_22270 [Thermoanaerobaculia bacterium]|nr:hypothetical protein [Thermoanaerobaculia bacterium]